MEGGPWESIRRNYTFLSNKLYLSEELLRLLYQEEFIGRGDLERLRNVHELNSSRLSNLLDLLLHQRDDKFDPFCRCLRRVGQGHIADVLMDQGGQTQGSGQTSRAQAASCRVPDGRTGVQSGANPSLSPTSPIVTDQHMETMKSIIGADWIPFGRAVLKYSAEQVRDIVSPYANEQLRDSEKAYYILSFWQQRDGVRATVERLLEGCEKINKRGAAELALSSMR